MVPRVITIFLLVITYASFTGSDKLPEVLEVEASGKSGKYTFNVTLSTPDTGCKQYADWWEVMNEDGELLYRRILAHSHVKEQPFTRSGGPVNIDEEEIVIVRLHMNNTGYSTRAMKGSVKEGFAAYSVEKGFASAVEQLQPQPSGCAF